MVVAFLWVHFVISFFLIAYFHILHDYKEILEKLKDQNVEKIEIVEKKEILKIHKIQITINRNNYTDINFWNTNPTEAYVGFEEMSVSEMI